jgi:hypothetical protein
MKCDIHTLKPSYDYIVGMYVTLHRILKPSYDYIVGMYVTLHRILKPSGTCHSGCCELPFSVIPWFWRIRSIIPWFWRHKSVNHHQCNFCYKPYIPWSKEKYVFMLQWNINEILSLYHYFEQTFTVNNFTWKPHSHYKKIYFTSIIISVISVTNHIYHGSCSWTYLNQLI